MENHVIEDPIPAGWLTFIIESPQHVEAFNADNGAALTDAHEASGFAQPRFSRERHIPFLRLDGNRIALYSDGAVIDEAQLPTAVSVWSFDYERCHLSPADDLPAPEYDYSPSRAINKAKDEVYAQVWEVLTNPALSGGDVVAALTEDLPQPAAPVLARWASGRGPEQILGRRATTSEADGDFRITEVDDDAREVRLSPETGVGAGLTVGYHLVRIDLDVARLRPTRLPA